MTIADAKAALATLERLLRETIAILPTAEEHAALMQVESTDPVVIGYLHRVLTRGAQP